MGGILALGRGGGCRNKILALLSDGGDDCDSGDPRFRCRVNVSAEYVPRSVHSYFSLAHEFADISCAAALVAAQAHSSKADRAVVISSRNFLRSLGGACGLAVASALFSNTLFNNLPPPPSLPENTYDGIISSVFSVPDLSGLSEEHTNIVLDVYTEASRSVFYFWVGCISICWLLTVFIKDKGLQRKEEREASKAPSPTAARSREAQDASYSTTPVWVDDEGSTTEAENAVTEREKTEDKGVGNHEAKKEEV